MFDASTPAHEESDGKSGAEAGTGVLLPFEGVLEAWRAAGGTRDAALAWTRHQVGALRGFLDHDDEWQRLVQIFHQGRAMDAWLAADWPAGFDELLLCAPLCQLVRFECARCPIGERQQAYSCAHPATVFGRVGELLQQHDRDGLRRHLEHVESMLQPASSQRWDLERGAPAAPDD